MGRAIGTKLYALHTFVSEDSVFPDSVFPPLQLFKKELSTPQKKRIIFFHLETEGGEQMQFFFLWLLLQGKIMTANRIIKSGGQANPICQLCRMSSECILHLAANYSYTQVVWSLVSQQLGQQNLMGVATNLKTQWSELMSDSVDRNQNITYTICKIWKERYRRLYENKAAPQLSSLIRHDVAALRLA